MKHWLAEAVHVVGHVVHELAHELMVLEAALAAWHMVLLKAAL
jgi:hypothetical protein